MQKVVSHLTVDGRVVNRIVVDHPCAIPITRTAPRYALHERVCIACRRPAQLRMPHGWTCERCDPYPRPVSPSV